jgi:hypothetical protein
MVSVSGSSPLVADPTLPEFIEEQASSSHSGVAGTPINSASLVSSSLGVAISRSYCRVVHMSRGSCFIASVPTRIIHVQVWPKKAIGTG